MATQVEEVVVRADAVELEQLLENRDDGALDGRARTGGTVRARRARRRREARARSTFPLLSSEARPSSRRWSGPCRRAAGREAVAQLLATDGVAVGGHDVRDEPAVARFAFAGDDDAMVDRRMVRQRGRDLVELDPMTADLHLVVEPAEEVDVAFGPTRTRSPVRYIRAPGSETNGSARNRSAVSSGRFR